MGLVWVFLLFLIIAVVLLLFTDTFPQDVQSPLNFLLFQQPKAGYTDQLVNKWINKPWRHDGARIPARLEVVEPVSPYLIIYSHGNAEDLSTCTQFIRELSQSLQVNVLAYDYSGYGLNTAERWERTEEGINSTLSTVIDYAREELHFNPENIVLYGYSLGSGPSTVMAGQYQTGGNLGGLILQGAYTSVTDVIKHKVGATLAGWFNERWNNLQNIKVVKCPVLILHGQSDGLIPVTHAHTLAKNVSHKNVHKVIFANVGHTKFVWTEVLREIRKWWPRTLSSP